MKEALFEFLDLFLEAKNAVGELLERMGEMPDEVWRHQPQDFFGPGEALVHIAQVFGFTKDYILPQVALRNVELPEVKKCSSFKTFAALEQWITGTIVEMGTYLNAMDIGQYRMFVVHPLACMQGPCRAMLDRLLIAHTFYHLGQATAMIKVLGHGADLPPLYFMTNLKPV